MRAVPGVVHQSNWMMSFRAPSFGVGVLALSRCNFTCMYIVGAGGVMVDVFLLFSHDAVSR